MGLQDLAMRVGRGRPRPLAAIAVGLLCAFAGTLFRWALEPLLGDGYPFITYFLAVIAAAALGGVLSGAVSLAASMLLAWYLFVPFESSFRMPNEREALGLVTFGANAALSGAVAVVLRATLAALTHAEGRQKLLIDELNHRVKNTLATVQSLAFQTARTTTDYGDFQVRFTERLGALAAAHDLLTRERWEGAELGALLGQVLKPFDAERGRITVQGPEVNLSPNAAVTTTLALHELATNAVKHGALANGNEGRVDVRWAVEGRELALEWRESGVRDLPDRQIDGFGSRLLKAAARELDAKTETEFGPDGLAHRWRVPLSDKVRARL